jgi:hypothetical protein
MKRAHGINGFKKVMHLPDREARLASFILLTLFLLPTFLVNRALGDGLIIETDNASYTVGETVSFSGQGYLPGGTSYEISVSYGGSIVAKIALH